MFRSTRIIWMSTKKFFLKKDKRKKLWEFSIFSLTLSYFHWKILHVKMISVTDRGRYGNWVTHFSRPYLKAFLRAFIGAFWKAFRMMQKKSLKLILFYANLILFHFLIKIRQFLSIMDNFLCLGCQSFRIAREHRSFADVVQAKIKHDDTLHANSTASMRRTSETEGIDVGGDFCDV